MKMFIQAELSIWVLLVFFSGATGEINCDHCLYGPEYCHSDRCLYGCITGWTGDDCNINCTIPSCIDCELTSLGQECRRCKNGLYGKYCNLSCSFFCKYGETHCDREGKCNYGCERGWVGDLCNRRECIFSNCQSCEQWSNGQPYCKLCEVGYFWDGSVCGECSPNCVGGRNSCNTSTGACTYGCVDNWIGANCNLQCNLDQCLNCSTVLGPNRVVCTQCQSGYFLQDGMCVRCGHCKNGETCDYINGTCPNGCADRFQGDTCSIFCDIPNCEKCKAIESNRTVCELCKSGYYNSPATCQLCNFSCGGGPQKCDPRTGKCTDGCLVGYYGEFCNYICSQHCVNKSCSSLNGNCNCEEGWFGSRCDRECPVNCDECDGFAVSNTCSRCQQGWYGTHCEIACPENCLQEPYRDRCDKVTGQCNMGCYGSMYGKFCNKTCSPNCIGKCDQLSGNCSNGCVSAWYGPTCEQKCSSSCKDASPGFRICDRDNGTCYFGCENGRYGETCDKICSYNCKNQTCVMTSGDCVVCMKGFYGTYCSQQCQGHCMESECDKLSGICTRGCVPGYFGIKCDQVCSPNCIDYKCDRDSGYCVEGCIDGFYGNTCSQICNKNCLNNTCQQTTGTCNQGCKSGYMGALCVQGCYSGFFGENCEKSCGQCINDGPCLPTNGKCPQGCALGWGKDTCDSKLQYDRAVEETTSLPVTIQAGISAAGLIFLLFLGVVIFIVYRRRHHKHVKKERDSMAVSYSLDGYSSQAVILTNGLEHSSNLCRKISLDHVHISHTVTQVEMVPTLSSQSVDRSHWSEINISHRDDKKSEDNTCGSSSALPSKDAECLIDVVNSDKKDLDEMMKRQKERIIKLKKQGIPVETYLRISTPMHIIQSTCTTDNDACGAVDSHGGGPESKETKCCQNIKSGVNSGVFETQGLDVSVKNADFLKSTAKDAMENSASSVKDAMENSPSSVKDAMEKSAASVKDAMDNSAPMKHITVRGAKCSVPVGNTKNIGTQHSTAKDLAKSHEENSIEEMKNINISVKRARCSTPTVCIPIRSVKCWKPQKDDIGKGIDYSSMDCNVQSSWHITPNQIIDTTSTSCVTPQHSNTERTAIQSELDLNNCTDTVKSSKPLDGTSVECPLYSAYDRDIHNTSARCPVPDVDMSFKSAGYSTSNAEMSVRRAQCLTPDMDMCVRSGKCLTPDMDMCVRSGKCLTPDMDMCVRSGKCLTPDMDMCVRSGKCLTPDMDINIVKNLKTNGENASVQSVEYKTCKEFDSHFKCDPADKMSKPDMPIMSKYFGVDSEVAGKNFMPQSGGSFGNKDGEFLNNEHRQSQISRHKSGNAVAMLDSENIFSQQDPHSSKSVEKSNIFSQQDPHSSKSVEKSNRSLENRIMQLLRSDLIKDFFKFSDDITVYEDLQTFLHQNELQLPSNRLYHFSVNICTGLNYLHQQKIIHRLLRAKSIYIDKKMITKIGDLEWAQQVDDISDQQVTLPDDYHRWLAPESLLYGKFSLHSNVWSFGLILWEIFNLGLEPFTNIEPDMLKMRLQEGIRPKKPRNCDIRLYRVMKTCWRYAGEDRPSVESILSQLSSLMKSQNPIDNGELFV
ncbi:hypothetical protein CHS0354_010600 [Potamilus streckersoni]|uniref:Protein kinase domain-containing protein n=1 Tax=Potamilus streckersoni TaxID=2493646 RepID=A0AAE0SH11_9BIVA|nr:hypothetical protein CHS0354_010600 [Potamilus streckersoni]